jgi:acetoin utilization protein AcuB
MFLIRELSGAISPYSPGMIRQLKIVDSVNPLTPTSSINASNISMNAPVLAAYEQVVHPDTPRRRLLYASELMTPDLITIYQSATLREAYQLFAKKRFRHIPVISSSKQMVGIISDRDLLKRAARMDETAQAIHHNWENDRVDSVMAHPVLAATPDTELREIARVMFDEKVGCTPILDDSHQLIGIITRSDVLRALLVHSPLDLWR